MSLFLALDATTYQGSVAIFRDETVLAACDVAMRGADEERLMPAVDAALRAARLQPAQLEGVLCAGGPGSFTSLRIAASIAKGLSTALAIPLSAVPSLALIAASYGTPTPRRIVVALDALRGELYLAAVDRSETGEVLALDAARRIAVGDAERVARELGGPLVGPDYAPHTWPHARAAMRVRALHEVVDLDRWEPAYGRLAEAQVKWEAAHGRPLLGPSVT